MKRSEINTAILRAKSRLAEYCITLPDFAYWSPDDWRTRADATGRIRERMLGWDVTDFGTDDFHHIGAVLFTLRNGDKRDAAMAAPYAEKYIVLEDDTEQEIPLHYHMDKTEDIINRGGGIMVLELYYKAPDGGLDRERAVNVWRDGIRYTVQPGEKICVTPGNSITLEPYMYHRFYAEKGKGLLIAGEVSKVNDDVSDNVFLVDTRRFCPIEEDEAAVHPLANEYESL